MSISSYTRKIITKRAGGTLFQYATFQLTNCNDIEYAGDILTRIQYHKL